MNKFIDKNYLYAIVGASHNKEKFGYKVLKNLTDKGYQAVPINPNYDEIYGLTCFASLLELDDRPDVVIIVTPPEVSLKIIEQCANLQLDRVWFQPGAEDQEVINLAEELGLEIITDQCIMIQAK